MPDYAHARPEQPAPRPAGRVVRRGRRGGRDRALRPRPRGRARGPQPRRPARPREVNLGAPVRVWRNVGGGTADAPAPMGHWLGVPARASRAATATRSARRSRCGSARRSIGRASSSSAAATSAASSAGRTSGSGRRRGARSGSPGRTASRDRGMRVPADGFAIIERGAAAPVPWTPGSRGGRRTTTRTAATRRRSTCRTSARPGPRPELPPARYPARVARAAGARGRARVRPARRLRGPRAQREPLVPHRLRPAVRGGAARRRPGRPAARSSSATSAGARPAPRRCRCASSCSRTSACPSQPRDRSRPLARDPGAGRGSGAAARVGRARLEAVRGPVAASRSPRIIVGRAARARRAAAGLVENANDLLVDPADGLRVINDVDQLAAFEHAATRTSRRRPGAAPRAAPRDDRGGGGRGCWAGTGRRSRAT